MRCNGFLIFVLVINLIYSACRQPEPIAFSAKVGMKKKEVAKILGEPWYSGGYVASVEPTAKYTPQRDRFLLFWVYPDSSLIVFKRDTVFEIYGNVRPYKQRLAQQAKLRRTQHSTTTLDSMRNE